MLIFDGLQRCGQRKAYLQEQNPEDTISCNVRYTHVTACVEVLVKVQLHCFLTSILEGDQLLLSELREFPKGIEREGGPWRYTKIDLKL